jgi:hypothetical protein
MSTKGQPLDVPIQAWVCRYMLELRCVDQKCRSGISSDATSTACVGRKSWESCRYNMIDKGAPLSEGFCDQLAMG